MDDKKSAKVVAEDLAYTARLKYTGIGGLELGATLQHQQDVTQSISNEASVLLIEVHTSYSNGPFAIRVL
jgi:predicted porin